jgi:hypothetical protein
MRNAYKILVGITQMERSLGNPMHRWMADIKMDLRVCKLVHLHTFK